MDTKHRIDSMVNQLIDATPKKQADLLEQMPTVQDEEYYLAMADDYYLLMDEE